MADYTDSSLAVSKKYMKKAKFEFLERLYFYTIPTAQKRTAWLKKKNKLALMGEHIHWQPRKYPTDGARLKIHNNVAIAAGVEFTMHDIIHWVFDGMAEKRSFVEYRDCIEIFDNVFIVAGARILPGVSIGPNAIVAAGAIVNKNVEPGTIVGGVPARVIGSFDTFKDQRMEWSKRMQGLSEDELNLLLWTEFDKTHSRKNKEK